MRFKKPFLLLTPLLLLAFLQGCQGCGLNGNEDGSAPNSPPGQVETKEELEKRGVSANKRGSQQALSSSTAEDQAARKAGKGKATSKTGAQVGEAGYAVLSGSVLEGEKGKKFVRLDISVFNLSQKSYTFSEENFRLVSKSGEAFTQSKNGDSVGFFPDTLTKPFTLRPKKNKTVTLIYELPAEKVSGARLRVTYENKSTLLEIPYY